MKCGYKRMCADKKDTRMEGRWGNKAMNFMKSDGLG
jgi:hypothetical protein